MSTEATAETFLDKLDHAATRREIFEHALAAVLAQLSPERALLAYRDKETDELSAQASHGLDPQTVFVAGEISTELIKTVLRDKQGVCLVDANRDPSLGNRTSVVLSGLRSIVCVPILHASGLVIGLIYADNRIRAGAFDPEHQDWMEKVAERIAARLMAVGRNSEAPASDSGKSAPPARVDEQEWQSLRAQAFQVFRENKLTEAIELLRKVVQLGEGFPKSDPRRGKCLGELAEMQRQASMLVEAERDFIEAIDLLERLGPNHRSDLAPVLTNLATLYFAQGNGRRAEGLYRRALEIWAVSLSSDDRRLAPLYFNLATLRRSAGAMDEAKLLFTRALNIADKAWGPEHSHSVRCRAALEELNQA